MKNLIQPYLTEKSAASMEQGLYVFLVHPDADKNSITKELKALHDVTAVSVRVVNMPARKVNFQRRAGVQAARRKAYIQLAPKQKIAGFESLTEKDKAKDTKKEEKN